MGKHLKFQLSWLLGPVVFYFIVQAGFPDLITFIASRFSAGSLGIAELVLLIVGSATWILSYRLQSSMKGQVDWAVHPTSLKLAYGFCLLAASSCIILFFLLVEVLAKQPEPPGFLTQVLVWSVMGLIVAYSAYLVIAYLIRKHLMRE